MRYLRPPPGGDGGVPVYFAGPDEISEGSTLEERLTHRVVVVRQADLMVCAALLRFCDIVVGNDSGLMHVAVAMGVKTFALFGPTDPGRTAPWGNRHQVIRRGLECSPCWSIRNLGVGMVKCIYNDNVCMQQIAAGDVAGQVLDWLHTGASHETPGAAP